MHKKDEIMWSVTISDEETSRRRRILIGFLRRESGQAGGEGVAGRLPGVEGRRDQSTPVSKSLNTFNK